MPNPGKTAPFPCTGRGKLISALTSSIPAFFVEFPVAIPLDLYSLPQLEAIIADIVREEAKTGRKNLLIRHSPAAEDAQASYLDSLPSEGSLEQQLTERKLHLMILNLHRYDSRVVSLLNEFVARMRPLLDAQGLGILHPVPALFISSPNSIARLHNDPEQGILHQLRGTKTIHIYPIDEAGYPLKLSAGESATRYREATRLYLTKMDSVKFSQPMVPGQAVFIPNLAPHWVLAGPEISVSLSFNFFTYSGLRRQKVAQLNRWLERRGLNPAPYRQGAILSALKCAAYDVLAYVGRVHLT
jgi:hypothetical protein